MDLPVKQDAGHELSAIAEQLAEQGWCTVHNLFSPADIRALRSACLSEWEDGRFHQAAIGRGLNAARRSEIRSDSVLWLDESDASPAVSHYFTTMQRLRSAVNRELYLGLAELEAHFAVYPAGSFYQKHLDRFRDDDTRTLSAVLYLNQDWPEASGGQLRLYLDPDCQTYRDIRPEAGTLVLFLSDRFWHEVLPATQQRLSITGWFRRRS
ncbi:2OG-Fe(II) oxygenase [Craterilacuibacter sinensis]|uniref:2OG-Fe(II) oxygenase n=1 Tax=Craterilacuibacter sinensis TaxID=2686017 RepID=A0A845BMS2_9NEIS|nr:2OG-Fe(II) oxygenase [Craterilacuibacter sinensis]MXR35751.1 2OG-Fe(II) oxygenase [Craterilacuibacter sinensis]